MTSQLQYQRSEYLQLECYFRDDQSNLVDPKDPTATFKKTADSVSVSPTVMAPLEKVIETDTGHYRVDILTTGLQAISYTVTFEGYYPVSSPNKVTTTGTFTLCSIPTEQVLINELRWMLQDELTSRYQLDDPTLKKWENKEVYLALQQALRLINSTPPHLASLFTFETIEQGLLLEGAFCLALRGRVVLEIANEFQYTDELSLSLQRSPKYWSLVSKLYDQWLIEIKLFKKHLGFRQVQPIAVRSIRIPLTARTVLSMLPYMKVIFEPR